MPGNLRQGLALVEATVSTCVVFVLAVLYLGNVFACE